MNERRTHLRAIVLTLLVFAAVASIWLDKPYTGHHDWDLALYHNAVNHYLDDGYSTVKYLQVFTPPAIPLEHAWYYRSNPPIIPITASLFVRVLVNTEAFIRLPGIFVALISICLLYVFSSRIFGRRAGLRAAMFYTFSGFTMYFSRTVNHEAFGNLGVLILLLFYVQWMRHHHRRDFLGTCFMAFAGLWIGHYMAFFLVMLFLYSLIFGTRYERIHTLVIGLVGVMGLVTWLAFTTENFTQEGMQALIDIFQYRTSADAYSLDAARNFSTGEYIARFALRLCYGVSPFAIAIAAYGVYRLEKENREHFLPLVLLASAITYTTLFRNATYLHDYLMYGFAPALTLLAGYGLHKLWRHPGWLPRTRPERFASAGVYGHIIVGILISVYLIRLSDDFKLWVADIVAERTEVSDRIITNLPDFGPQIEFYANRDLDYNDEFDESTLPTIFTDQHYAMYFACVIDLPDSLPEGIIVEWLDPCYVITWKPDG